MESMSTPTPDEAAALLADADDSAVHWARGLTLPRFFHTSIGVAIAAQTASAAYGIAVDTPRARWALVGGLALFAAVAAVQLLRFRRHNGVWVQGLVDRVVLGGGQLSSTAYLFAFAMAVWAGFGGRWWLVGLLAVAGGGLYAWAGSRWWQAFQERPVTYATGLTRGWTILAVAVAAVGTVTSLVLLLTQS